jgi:hypothetical protein
VQEEMIEERDAREQRYRIELRENMKDAPFVEPQPFGDPGCAEKLSASRLRSSVVSVALLSGDYFVLLYMSVLMYKLIYSSTESYSFVISQ